VQHFGTISPLIGWYGGDATTLDCWISSLESSDLPDVFATTEEATNQQSGQLIYLSCPLSYVIVDPRKYGHQAVALMLSW